MKIRKNSWLCVICLLLLPFWGGCSTSDDVQGIFTGKTWRLTYISQGKSGAWYRFPNTNDNDYKAYDPKTGTKRLTIEFNGSEQNNVVAGGFSTTGTVSTKGTWNANGESKAFSARITDNVVVDKNDKLAPIIRDAISNADEYGGNDMNLYIYFTYEGSKLFLAFAPVK